MSIPRRMRNAWWGALLVVLVCAGCQLPRWTSAHTAADSTQTHATAPAAAEPTPTTPAPAAPLPPWLRLTRLDGLVLIAFAGWFAAMALVVVLLRQNQQWRTSFQTREWYLVPSDHGDVLLAAVERIIEALRQNSHVIQHSLGSMATATSAHTDAVQRTRSEFDILRTELAEKRAALEDARLGVEFRVRRPVLLAIARAADMIREDTERGRDASSTLQGLRAELEDCLQDHGIVTRSPEVGQPLASDASVDLASVVRVPAPDDSHRGNICVVDRPAYIIRSADGQEEVLLPARVHIHV